jgi:imidazolonepropionase-like amidohydrolase
VLGWRALRAQTPRSVPIPGVEIGQPITAFALRNVSVIDATGKPAQPAMTVIIAKGRIESLGPVATTRVTPGVQVFDAGGKFLIPGLWDMHGHPVWLRESTDTFPMFIANGVTGSRTMGGRPPIVARLLQARKEIADGKRLGPRLVVASPTMWGSFVRNAGESRAAVRQAISDGADFIKVYDDLTRESFFAIADEAKTLGSSFSGHVPDEVSLSECAKAGQRSFEHMAGIRRHVQQTVGGNNGYVRMESLSPAQVAAVAAVFRETHSWICPTLIIPFGQTGDDSLGMDPRLKYVDSSIRKEWAEILKRAQENPRRANVRQRHGEHLAIIGAMHKAGVGILAGIDASLGPAGAHAIPGFGMHDELRLLVSAGLSPMDALQTATYNAAQFLGLLDSLGTVERGKLAELVLLDANPLDDISNTRKINTVFTGGRVYRRPALDAILSAVEANARD